MTAGGVATLMVLSGVGLLVASVANDRLRWNRGREAGGLALFAGISAIVVSELRKDYGH